MAQKQNFFMVALMVVLLFSIGLQKTECRNVVRIKCISPCYASDICVEDCKDAGFNHGECTRVVPATCCCST
ncbi:hypothetical protein P8452_01560 [Trifolium repens]|nr:hypothetical protein P8452_01560 [Trifolium repens]